jgi:hypothetical protein
MLHPLTTEPTTGVLFVEPFVIARVALDYAHSIGEGAQTACLFAAYCVWANTGTDPAALDAAYTAWIGGTRQLRPA